MAFNLEAYKQKNPDRWAGHLEEARERSGLPTTPTVGPKPAPASPAADPNVVRGEVYGGYRPDLAGTTTGGPYGRGYNKGGRPRGGPGMSRAEIDEMWSNVERGRGVIDGVEVEGFYGPGSTPTPISSARPNGLAPRMAGASLPAIADTGRGGDTEIAHVTPGETIVPEAAMENPEIRRLLMEIFERLGLPMGRFIVGGDNSRNPDSGMAEFYDPRRPTVGQRPAPQLPDDTGYRQGARGPGAMTPPGPKMPTSMGTPGRQMQGMVPKVPTGQPPTPKLQTPTGPTGTAATPQPVARDRTGKPIQGVSGRLTGLLSRTNPYIQRARTSAAQQANRRGLLNTSIAAGAGEAAAIDAALPIAQADAAIAAGERGMRSQEFMQERGLRHDTNMRSADRALTQLLQERDHRTQQLMQTERLSHDVAQRRADREFQERFQNAQNVFQAAQAEAQRKFAGVQAELDRETQRKMQEQGLSFDQAQSEANRELNRQAAISSATQRAQDQYQTSLDRLSLNTDLPAEERQRLEEHYAFLRDQAIDAIRAIYDVDLSWAQSTRPPVAEAA